VTFPPKAGGLRLLRFGTMQGPSHIVTKEWEASVLPEGGDEREGAEMASPVRPARPHVRIGAVQ